MADSDPKKADSWAEHERTQRRTRLSLTHRERLQWLEQAKVFARMALRSAKMRNEKGTEELKQVVCVKG